MSLRTQQFYALNTADRDLQESPASREIAIRLQPSVDALQLNQYDAAVMAMSVEALARLSERIAE